MSAAPALSWLPPAGADWRSRLTGLRNAAQPDWADAVALAKVQLDAARTNALAAIVDTAFPDGPRGSPPVRLALLGSSTTGHLVAGIKVGALRREFWVRTFEPDYGQVWHALADRTSALHAFAPTAVLFAFDATALTAGLDAAMSDADAADVTAAMLDRIERGWEQARTAFRAPVLMQTVLPTIPTLMGSNEHRLLGSPAAAVGRLNAALRARATRAGVGLLALDERAALDGLAAWHDPVLWHHAKQEVAPGAAPLYGDLVARLLAAARGGSAKCLVLDLDNTLWGGVVGDDGIDRLVLGAGSALGEAFAAVQAYAKALSRRGVILAVCSKNDEATATAVFDRHPDMVLRRADIACFAVNWTDKAANLRAIAQTLNIGLDALVFVDDNPFEREQVRAALPEVAVPELPDDPALVPARLAEAGYFESLALTADDRDRTAQYRANVDRATAAAAASDMQGYLKSLDMRLIAAPFDRIGLPRITQLLNKTNQFNLTTRRLSEDDVAAMIDDPRAVTLQLRLVDRLGDNGMIAVVAGRHVGDDIVLDDWLMSCRVLGRGVETATLAVLLDEARRRGVARLIGTYRPTPKNGMVRDLYATLGFAPLGEAAGDDGTRWAMAVAEGRAGPHVITIERPLPVAEHDGAGRV